MSRQEAIAAIRADKFVGHGTCSPVDECYDDDDLDATFILHEISTVDSALKWAYDQHEMWLGQALNARWGDDDDPQLIAWNEWQEREKA